MNDALHATRSAGCSLYTCHVAAISKSNSRNDIDVWGACTHEAPGLNHYSLQLYVGGGTQTVSWVSAYKWV